MVRIQLHNLCSQISLPHHPTLLVPWVPLTRLSVTQSCPLDLPDDTDKIHVLCRRMYQSDAGIPFCMAQLNLRSHDSASTNWSTNQTQLRTRHDRAFSDCGEEKVFT